MGQVDSSNHKFIKTEIEVRTEITIRRTIRTGTYQTVLTEDRTDKIEVGLGTNKIIREETLEET